MSATKQYKLSYKDICLGDQFFPRVPNEKTLSLTDEQVKVIEEKIRTEYIVSETTYERWVIESITEIK